MKLFFKAGSCSLSPHIVLKESGLAFETESVDLKSKVTASGANYLEINPKGYVPALVLDSGELHKSFGPFFNPQATQEWKEAARANIERRLTYADQQLKGQDYLLGSDFSVADAYLFTVLSWTKYLKLDLARWPNLQAFQGRVAARPAVQAAMKAEGLI